MQQASVEDGDAASLGGLFKIQGYVTLGEHVRHQGPSADGHLPLVEASDGVLVAASLVDVIDIPLAGGGKITALGLVQFKAHRQGHIRDRRTGLRREPAVTQVGLIKGSPFWIMTSQKMKWKKPESWQGQAM